MSADNYIAIIQDNKEWVGYHCCASLGYTLDPLEINEDNDIYLYQDQPVVFRVKTVRQAIKKAQSVYTEYGYRFIDFWGVKDE